MRKGKKATEKNAVCDHRCSMKRNIRCKRREEANRNTGKEERKRQRELNKELKKDRQVGNGKDVQKSGGYAIRI